MHRALPVCGNVSTGCTPVPAHHNFAYLCTNDPHPFFPLYLCTIPMHGSRFQKNLAKRQKNIAGICFYIFLCFFVGAVQGCDVGGAETQCRIYNGNWYDGASVWGGTGYNVGAGVVRYSLSGLGKLLKRFFGGYVYYFSIMVCSCLTYHL